MNKTFVGQNILIHCYKHDGSIHRCWDKGLHKPTGKEGFA